jgi:hypothetical protein
VVGASVSLLAHRVGLAHGKTGDDGSYELVAPVPGRYRVQFSQPGYRLLITPEFEVRSGESVDFSFRASLLPAVALDTTTVEGRPVPKYLAPFYRRRAEGMGKFVTREEFERYYPQQVTDIMRRERAFDILPNTRRGVGSDTRSVIITSHRAIGFPYGPVGGECPPLIFLDGTLVGNARDADIDALLAVGTIEAMEFYEGGVQVPGEFAVNGSNCGVIVVWSRRDAGGAIAQGDHWIDVGTQIGGQWANGGVEYGRVGAQVSLRLVGPVELHSAFNLLVRSWNGGGAARSGHQVTLALRARPLGAQSPAYLGAGVTNQDFTEQPVFGTSQVARGLSQQDLVLLAGVTVPVSRFRPLVEVQMLNPAHPARAQLHLFTGLTFRLP